MTMSAFMAPKNGREEGTSMITKTTRKKKKKKKKKKFFCALLFKRDKNKQRLNLTEKVFFFEKE